MTYRHSLLTALIVLFSLPVGISTVSAQGPTSRPPSVVENSTVESSALSLRQLIRRIFRDDQRDDPPTISRGELCLLSPASPGQETKLWHSEPVFVWRGPIGKMVVLDAATDQIMWTYEPAAEETRVRYQGEPLRSGRPYYWQVFETNESISPTVFLPFQILPLASRLLIANGLAIAENRASSTGGSDEIARAQYFAFRGLPTDALQSLFLIESPTDELIEARQEAVEILCQ